MSFDLDRSLDNAETALKAVAGRATPDPDDLLCDLLHWIEANGGNVELALGNARRNWSEERAQ